MQFSALMFDFGGTIDTDGVHWSELFWTVYESFNVPVGKPDYEKAYVEANNYLDKSGIAGRMTFHEMLEIKIRKQLSYLIKTRKLHHGIYRERLAADMAGACYSRVRANIEDKRRVFHKLCMKSKLGVVSNFYGNMAAVLKEFGISEYFSFVADSAAVGFSKPDERLFMTACKMAGCLPSQAVMIGDSYGRDIVPAKRCGMGTVWLKGRSWREEPESAGADYIISSLGEIERTLFFES